MKIGCALGVREASIADDNYCVPTPAAAEGDTNPLLFSVDFYIRYCIALVAQDWSEADFRSLLCAAVGCYLN